MVLDMTGGGQQDTSEVRQIFSNRHTHQLRGGLEQTARTASHWLQNHNTQDARSLHVDENRCLLLPSASHLRMEGVQGLERL